MRLRNKKTGEILDLYCHRAGDFREKYDSLAELNAEWCDAPKEEPEEYWYITDNGYVCAHKDDGDSWDVFREKTGNRFSSREEAEKAVEKLKIYNKLKQKGFVFSGWYYSTEGQLVILADNHEFSETEPEDLTELFGDKIC